jgi:hypothetical protein
MMQAPHAISLTEFCRADLCRFISAGKILRAEALNASRGHPSRPTQRAPFGSHRIVQSPAKSEMPPAIQGY